MDAALWPLYETAVGWCRRDVRDEDDARTIVLDVIGTLNTAGARDLKAFLRTAVARAARDFNNAKRISVYDAAIPDRPGVETPENIAIARQQAAAIDVQFPSLFIDIERSDLGVNDRKRLSRMRVTVRKMLDETSDD
jgi:hypothetical protein